MDLIKRFKPTWAEGLLILGLVLINLGFFLGRSEIVDAWCRYVAHHLDVRYWTWKTLLPLTILGAAALFYHRKKHGIVKYGHLAVALLAFATVWQGILEAAWNSSGKTFIVRQRAKGVPVTNDRTPLDYKVHVPPGFFGLGGRRPLIVFLHGAGGAKKDIEDMNEDFMACLPKKLQKNFPFVVISPVSGRHGWKSPQILQILDETTIRWNIDPRRIYLTGYSMGGFGTFNVACDSPGTFAAIVPVAGGGDEQRAERLKDVPTRAFHGDADEVVPCECSAKMIEAMNEAGCRDVEMTTFEGAGHGITHQVYSNPELYRWMLNHRR